MAIHGMSDTLLDHWFAVQVWAGREHKSALQLQSRGYEIFLPCATESRRWSDRIKRVERPLFAGYLFARVSQNVLGKIVTAPGVIRIVGSGDRPEPVPTEEVETLRHVVRSGVRVEPWPHLEAGERVRVEIGPLKGAEGVVVMVKNERRLIASISLLRRSVGVELDVDCCQRVDRDRRTNDIAYH
jgi:transcription antitermination factor NusG